MSVTFALAIYFILWWLVLFAMLPIGVQSQVESGDVVRGTEAGAPVAPQLGRKVVLTTIVSAAIFGTFYGLNATGILDIGKVLFGRS